MSVQPQTGETARPRPKRRFQTRASQACKMCRVKKARCDSGLPCQTCVDRQFTCIYDQQSQARRRRQSESFASPQAHLPSVEHWNNEARRREPSREPGYQSASGSSTVGARENIMQAEGQQSLPLQDFQNSPDADTVGEVNRHTSGTEFYGSSSGFAMLSQLFSKARAHSSASHLSRVLNHSSSGDSPREGTLVIGQHPADFSPNDLNILSHESGTAVVYTTTSPLSVVNILHDKDSLLPESRPRSPLKAAGRLSTGQLEHSRGRTFLVSRTEVHSPSASQPTQPEPLHARQVENVRDDAEHYIHTAGLARPPSPDISICLLGHPMVLEMEYVNLFFENLHHVLPFLSPSSLRSRCEREIWTKKSMKRLRQDQMHFLSLYNMVLAIGSLTAGVDLFQAIRTELDRSKFGQAPSDPKKVITNIQLSRIYFQRARRLLGNIFEVCSLESAQTLLLMSLYCQYVLKPHASYMFSGMAVRTALAIGLADENNLQIPAAIEMARRTWWCLYCQETESSCTSGRSSSLMNPDYYAIEFPTLDGTQAHDPIPMDSTMLIIPELAKVSAVLHQASREICHSSNKFSMQDKSRLAFNLDKRLESWRQNLPLCLAFNATEFREPESASKQKLILRLRYHHARMFLHRTFIATSIGFVTDTSRHVEQCLDAAKQTIWILHEAYTHRYYLRTWWYNCTYVLYASVIILYLILLDGSHTPGYELASLITVVRKALDVLDAMTDIEVARRCAALIREVLQVAEAYIRSSSRSDQVRKELDLEQHGGPACMARDQTSNTQLGASADAPSRSEEQFWTTTDLCSTRDDLLANLMDSSLLEGFAMGLDDPSFDSFDASMPDLGWNIGVGSTV